MEKPGINPGSATPISVRGANLSSPWGRFRINSGVVIRVRHLPPCRSRTDECYLEEPGFWARAGWSDSFKREWQVFYDEPWQAPDSSPDAQYRASKLKFPSVATCIGMSFRLLVVASANPAGLHRRRLRRTLSRNAGKTCLELDAFRSLGPELP